MTLAAWLLTPLVFVLITSGASLGFERLLRVRLPDAALVPFGYCVVVVVALFGFWAGLRGLAVTLVVAVLAVAGIASACSDLRGHAARCSGLLAFALAYGLYMLPVVATGHWTWTGYNFVNDTAVQMLLAGHLDDAALANPGFDPATSSTTSEVLRIYLETNYPVGSHAVLAVLDRLVPGGLAPLYQPNLALLGGTAAMALSGVLQRAGVRWHLAALGAAVAVGGNLTFQYALQGNMKELALLAALATAALLADALVTERELGLAVALGLAGATILAVYSAAGAPYLVLLAASVLLALLLRRVAWRWVLKAATVASAALVIAALPALLSLVTFGRVASGTFATPAALQNDLGHLLRPLKDAQVAGVWLTQDYRIAATGTNGALTDALSALVLAAAVIGALGAVRRRVVGPLLVAGPTLAALAILSPRVSPYANGKLLAIASVGVMLLAWFAIARAGRPHRPLAACAGALLCFGVAWSDALAYHGVKLAPTDRMASLRDVGERLEGRGLVLVNEPEEFAKVFATPAQVNASTESITPRQIVLRQPQVFSNRHFDLDLQALEYVEGFPWVVLRRSPEASRPPANFRQTYANEHYVVWKRMDAPTVLEHLPLEGRDGGVGRPSCQEVAALGRRAGAGGRLVASERTPPLVLDTASAAERSPGWGPHPYLPEMVVTATPGYARATVDVRRPGRYRGWVKGSFGRSIEVRVDGRRAGAAKGVDNLGQWHETGDVELGRGRHVLELRRAGGGLAPGDGYLGELGALLLTRVEDAGLRTVEPRDAKSLCGGSYDWIEAVRG
ncbi:MAG: hypothetical protein WKF94_11770 [Solirubrobacteraceae bacterium]